MFWLLVFYVPGRGFVSCFFHPVGAAFPPCRGFVSGCFAFILSLAAHLPPFTTQRRASAESPPPEVRIWASNRRPFRVTLANPTPCDASPPSSPTTPYSSESLPSPRHAQSCYRESPNKQCLRKDIVLRKGLVRRRHMRLHGHKKRPHRHHPSRPWSVPFGSTKLTRVGHGPG